MQITKSILAAKNRDVDYLNTKIQNKINEQINSFQLIDFITNPIEVVHYPTEFLIHWIFEDYRHTIYSSRLDRW